jgi:transposase
MSDKTKSALPVTPIYAAFVGIDWGDEKHAVSLCVAGSDTVERASLEQTPEALAQWANGLRARFPNGKIAVALEQSRGALLTGLLQYEHLVAYPVNPKSVARFREALHPSRAKDDPVDADLILDLLVKHRNHLRPWQPDAVATRQLALLNEQRRHFVDRRTALTNELLSHLKAVFPQAPELVGVDLGSALATDFLKKWPTLQGVQLVKPAVLRRFYYGHNSRAEHLISRRLALVKAGVALTHDVALLSPPQLGYSNPGGATRSAAAFHRPTRTAHSGALRGPSRCRPFCQPARSGSGAGPAPARRAGRRPQPFPQRVRRQLL